MLTARANEPLQPLIDRLAASGGGTLRLGAGTWAIPTPPPGGCGLRLGTRVVLEGAGSGRTRLVPLGSVSHYQTLLCGPATGGLSDVTLRGLTIAQPPATDGDLVVKAHQRGFEAALLRLGVVERVWLDDVALESVGVNGLILSGPAVRQVTLTRVRGVYRRVGAEDYDNSLVYLNGRQMLVEDLDLRSGEGGHGGLELHGGPAVARRVRVRGYGTAINLVSFSPPVGRSITRADSAERNDLWVEGLDADSVARGIALWTTPQMVLRGVEVRDSRIRIVPSRHAGQSISGISVAWGVRDQVGGTGRVTDLRIRDVAISWDTTSGRPVRAPVLESSGLSLVGGARLDSVTITGLTLTAPPYAAVRLGNSKAKGSTVGQVRMDSVRIQRSGWAALRASDCIPWRLEQPTDRIQITGLSTDTGCATATAWALVHQDAVGALTQNDWSRLGALYRRPILVLKPLRP